MLMKKNGMNQKPEEKAKAKAKTKGKKKKPMKSGYA